MLEVEFGYPVNNRMMKVVARCKSVINEKYVDGLSITFFDLEDNVVKVSFDADMFEDIEDEALIMLADLYYNKPVDHVQTH